MNMYIAKGWKRGKRRKLKDTCYSCQMLQAMNHINLTMAEGVGEAFA